MEEGKQRGSWVRRGPVRRPAGAMCAWRRRKKKGRGERERREKEDGEDKEGEKEKVGSSRRSLWVAGCVKGLSRTP